jgi:hypothetical protein
MWSGFSKDSIVSIPDASSSNAPADAGNVSVAFAFIDGAWRPRAVWDEINWTSYSAAYQANSISSPEWEIIIDSAADCSIPVSLGWNLVSVPTNQDYYDIGTVFNDQAGDGMTAWDRAMWYDPQDASDHWKQFNINWNGAQNDLTTISLAMGIWINITTVGDGFLTVTGYNPASTAINLRTGWNLIGYPARDDSTYSVASLKAAASATAVEMFNAGATYRTQAAPDALALSKGCAYWVLVPSDIVWTVDW